MERSVVPKLTKKNFAKQIYLRHRKLVEDFKDYSNIDELTGLSNDKALIQMLEGLQSSWERSFEKNEINNGTFVVFDLDGLKKVNSLFGERSGGDEYLVSVAKSLNEVLRPEDRSFRMGTSSDTFVLHLPNSSSREDLTKILDRVDERINSYQVEKQIVYPGITFGVSSSAACYGNDFSPNEAFIMADTKMINSKESKILGERIGNVGRSFCNL